jgi:hypothetical protein
MDNPPQIREPSGYYAHKTTSYSILARPQSDFIKTPDQKEREDQNANMPIAIWKMCNAMATAMPGKRKLSLFDANEVANRLAS